LPQCLAVALPIDEGVYTNDPLNKLRRYSTESHQIYNIINVEKSLPLNILKSEV